MANQYIEMGQARSVGKLLKVERRYLGIPTFNTIAADLGGRALYTDTGAIPNAPKAKIDDCLPDAAAITRLPRGAGDHARRVALGVRPEG